MITHYWLEKGISTLLFFIFIFLGFLSFGYPLQFDWLFIAFLVCLTTLYKRNPNIASIALVLLAVRGTGQVLFLYEGAYKDLLFYATSIVIFYKFKFDQQSSFLLLPILVICCITEIYWYYLDYPAPDLSNYILSISFNCLLRNLLTYRAHLTRFNPKMKLSGISLDFDLYKLTGIYNVIIAVMIVEYLIRHLTPLNPLLIYQVYSYILQLITLMFPYLVISYLIKSRFTINA